MTIITKDQQRSESLRSAPSLSKRQFLTGAAAIAVAAGVSTIAPHVLADAGNPDAELIAICDEFCSLERRQRAIADQWDDMDEDPPDELVEALLDRQCDLVDRMGEIPPSTLAGFVAVARSISAWNLEAANPGPHTDVTGNMIAALIIGLTTGQAAGGAS
jgi:hypothetical protein